MRHSNNILLQRPAVGILALAVLLTGLAGCGGSHSAAGTTPNSNPQQIQGIATPATVAVVTATNAN
jgi:hypothetical protein